MNSIIKDLINLDMKYAKMLETFEEQKETLQGQLQNLKESILEDKRLEAEAEIDKLTLDFEQKMEAEKGEITQAHQNAQNEVRKNFDELKDTLILEMYKSCIGGSSYGK